ncbi:MAG: LPS export ABC transporter permease LptF [Hyphomicrobiaceae bacterium]
MSLFGRYMFGQALGAFLLIMLSLTGVVWIATALKQLSLMTSQGQDALVFFKMTLLALPNLMALIAPIALLIATLHTLNRLNGDSELIVMTASGATVWRFAAPMLMLGAIVSLSVLIANHFVLPWSMRTLTSYIVQVRTDLISQVLQPGAFSSPETGLTFHIRDRDPSGRLLGLIMSDTRDRKTQVSYLAEEGDVLKEGDAAYLIMRNGHIIRHDAKADAATIIRFDRYVVDLGAIGPKQEAEALKPRARYFDELVHPDPKDALFKANPGIFRSELHERFVGALYPLVFVMVVVAYLGQARTNRQARTQTVILAFSLAALLRLLGLAANNLVTLKASAVWLVYALPIGAMVAAFVIAQMNMIPRRQTRLGSMLERAGEAVSAVLGLPLRLLGRLRPQRRAGAGAAR